MKPNAERQRTVERLAEIVGDSPSLLIAVGVDEPVKLVANFNPADRHAINRVHLEVFGHPLKQALAMLGGYLAGAPDADRNEVRHVLQHALNHLDADMSLS